MVPDNQGLAYSQGYPQQNVPMQPAQPNMAGAGTGPAYGSNQPSPPYAQLQPGMANQTMPAQVTPRYSEQYDGGAQMGMGPAGQPPISQPGMAPGQDLAMGSNQPYTGNPNPSGSGMTPNNGMGQPAGAMAASPTQPYAPGPQDGNPPLGLDGFCPVSLERTMRVDPQPRWIPGDPRWGLRHEGRTYLFAGPDEQQAFYNNPNYYAPVRSGADVVLQVEQGVEVPGVREFGARWRNRGVPVQQPRELRQVSVESHLLRGTDLGIPTSGERDRSTTGPSTRRRSKRSVWVPLTIGRQGQSTDV